MDTTTFTTNLTMNEIVDRLSQFDHFKIKERSENELAASVGSELKYRIEGSWINQNYQAPIVIDVASNGDGTSTVEMTRRWMLFTVEKDRQFFENGYAEIRKALEG